MTHQWFQSSFLFHTTRKLSPSVSALAPLLTSDVMAQCWLPSNPGSLGIKVFLHSSDSLAGPAFYGPGKVLIAGSDRLHADVDYTNKDSFSWNCDCCAGETTDASYACLTRLEMTSQTYFKQYEESNEHSAATFWEQLATERVCIKLTWIQALQRKSQC